MKAGLVFRAIMLVLVFLFLLLLLGVFFHVLLFNRLCRLLLLKLGLLFYQGRIGRVVVWGSQRLMAVNLNFEFIDGARFSLLFMVYFTLELLFLIPLLILLLYCSRTI